MKSDAVKYKSQSNPDGVVGLADILYTILKGSVLGVLGAVEISMAYMNN